MNVLILGSGGREHAIAWKVKQSEKCTNLFYLPGNPGTAQIATNVAAGVKDFEAIKKCVLENNIEIVIVGPEDPLVFGLKDMFAADEQLKDVLFVGPSKLGAQLEGSKDFAKEFMTRHNIPTAAYRSFTKETLEDADKFLDFSLDQDTKCVIVRMSNVPSIDATVMKNLEVLATACESHGVTLILSHVNDQPMKVMRKSGFFERVGAENFRPHIDDALAYAGKVCGETADGEK